MALSRDIGVGVIGLGFMGRTHVSAYLAAREAGYPCRVIAACDCDRQRLNSLSKVLTDTPFDPTAVHMYARPEELVNDSAVEAVSICTHTDTHVVIALAALEAGKHVLVEKPVALRSAEVLALAQAAAAAGTRCMPAMCIRFWPGWQWLHKQIDRRVYGAVRRAEFQRLAGPPDWAPGFYQDTARSGGAIVDLHIHDADFILWCFGCPESVETKGSLQRVITTYGYGDDGPQVTAEGGWVPGAQFTMRYIVAFEQATAQFDSAGDPSLALTRDGRTEPVAIARGTGYDGEIRHFLEAVADPGLSLRVSMQDAVKVTQLLEAERRSLETGQRLGL